MITKDIKAFIFDLDGTLIDTEKLYRVFWPMALAEYGFEMSDEQALEIRSLGRPFSPKKFKEWFGEGCDYYKVRDARKRIFAEYEAEHDIEGKPGAAKLLEYLRSKGYITAICTATDIERTERYLKMAGLEGYFDRLISATMVDEGKPSPKVYLYACEQLGLKPDECIAVEDAPNGIRSAYTAGLNVIMVPDQTEPDDSIRPMLTATVKQLDDIISLIDIE